jgi:hypothetical protein
MSLGNKLMALGQWIEKRFPEKLTATEVKARMRYHALESGVEAGRKCHEDDVLLNLVAALWNLKRKPRRSTATSINESNAPDAAPNSVGNQCPNT